MTINIGNIKNRMKKRLAENIDFTKSLYEFFEMTEDRNVIVYMKSNNEKDLKIVFSHVIHLSYNDGIKPKKLYQIEGEYLEIALKNIYGDELTYNKVKMFSLEDINNKSFITILGDSLIIIEDK